MITIDAQEHDSVIIKTITANTVWYEVANALVSKQRGREKFKISRLPTPHWI